MVLVSFLSTALGVSPWVLHHVPWWKCLLAFNAVVFQNAPRISIPLIVESDGKKAKKDSWDYEGRSWHMYSHILARNYGWSLEYIAQLEVDEALSKIQEILTDDQLHHEFLWAMSEMSYSFDSHTKTGKFNPLTRPYWMLPKVVLPKKTKLLKASMPVGNVDYSAIGDEYAPQEIKH